MLTQLTTRILLILTVIICSACYGAADESRWANLSYPVFLSPLGNSSSIEGPITSVSEDKNGFIWLVDSNGLWRWDSKSLVKATFTLSPMIDAALTKIQVCYMDAQGDIWVGSKRGIFKLLPGTNKLKPIAYNQLSSLSVHHIAVTQFNGEQIVVFASDRALYRFNVNSQQLEQFTLPGSPRVHALHVAPNHSVWVGTEEGIYNLSDVGKPVTDLQKDTAFPSQTRVSSILTTTAGQRVIGTPADGLFIQNKQGHYRQLSLNAGLNPWIYAITEITPNVLLLGTFGKGLIELNVATGLTRSFRHTPAQPTSLNDDEIWTVFRDSKGLVWIGSGNQLNVYNAGNTAIQYVFAGIHAEHGLSHRKIHSLQTLNDKLLVSTGDRGIEVVSPYFNKTEQWWPESRDPVETLYVSPQNKVYASSNFITTRIDTQRQQATTITVNGRKKDIFTTVFTANNTMLWLGGTDGLWMQALDKNLNEQSYNVTRSHSIASLLIDKETIWIGTWRGLFKSSVHLQNNRPAPMYLVDHPIINQQYISALFVDKSGQLWVGTEGSGLFVLKNKSSWHQIKNTEGLPSNIVAAIAGETATDIWLSTSRGIAAINTETRKVSYTMTGATAIHSPYARTAAAKTTAGNMVFGGRNGMTIINPEKLDTSVRPLSLVLTNIDVVTKDNTVESPSLLNNGLTLKPHTKRMSFEFIALDYLNPSHVQYRYRLQGLDDSWTQLDADHRIVTITQPPPGRYILQLEYSHDGISWAQNSLVREIDVLPAWYQTLIAKIIGLLLLCVLIYLGHRIGIRHYRNRQNVLERRVRERTEELVCANQKLSKQAKALKKASLTDALTGLNNRRFLSLHIDKDISLVHNYYIQCTQNKITPTHQADLLFFLLDLDHFKKINDTFGHNAGDRVLVETQQRLKQIFRDSDHLIRWGGEEFLIVVHNTPRDEARSIAERVTSAISAKPFLLKNDEKRKVTCSIGYAVYPLSQQHFDFFDWQATIGFADVALYGAKNNNRDTWMGISSVSPDTDLTTLEQIKRQPSKILDYADIQQRE